MSEDQPAEESEDGKMFLVKRIWVENLDSLHTEDLHKAHQEHIAASSISVMSSNLLDRSGRPIGVVSVKGFKTWDEVEHYVHGDPYTVAGLYEEITIEQIDMYVLNASFARAPDWYKTRFPERANAYTPP